jgi:hypothetical protein
MNDELKLLVEWSSPWKEFITAIRPALSRSPAPLDAEAHTGLFPYRGMLVALIVEMALLAALIVLPPKLASLKPAQPTPPPKYDVIYFSGDELPRTEDAGGARSGRSGRSGGNEGHHATQVIRVARGPSLKEQVVDAPTLNLPHSDSAVANLLAYKSVPGPPPDKGLESSTRNAEMPVTAVPPPAAIQDESLRSAPNLEARVIAPSPSALPHELTSRRVNGSRMDAVPPPVAVPREVAILNPQLTLPQSMVVRPAPSDREIRNAAARRGAEDARNQTVVPPAPQAANVLSVRQVTTVGNASVIAPPSELSNAVSARRQSRSMDQSRIVPPPAQINGSLMRHDDGLSQGNAVVRPAPSASAGSVSNGHRQPGGMGDSKVIPPPAQVNGSLMRHADGLSQGNAVIQPAPSASAGSVSNGHRQSAGIGDSKVIPPPVQVNGSSMRHADGLSQGNDVVQPAPSASAGSVSGGHRQPGSLSDSKVIPPPAEVSGSSMRHTDGLSQGNNVVQPAPSASAAVSNGRGVRRNDTLAEAVVPPSPVLASGIVLSARPGSRLASPSGSAGSLAMSPSGGANPGLGGTGGGAGISQGNGPGSSTTGEGSGAKTSGSGQGSNEVAHNGISPFPGTGGAGKGTLVPPAMPGVSVSGGGNNTVKLPSFGTDGAPDTDPAHSPAITNPGGPGITVIATSHSGGAFNFYGALKGDKVYTIYIDTALGTAVMQFADPKSATETYPEELTAPQALRAELPSDITASRLVIACTLDRSGLLKTSRVVEGNSPELSEKVLAALPRWKFRPAFRGNQPIEVNAILGFDIDTR